MRFLLVAIVLCEAVGETRGCLGWPPQRLKKVRGYLRGSRNALETLEYFGAAFGLLWGYFGATLGLL